jgi:hypothetical protein
VNYRLYFLDPAGQVVSATDLTFETDADALIGAEFAAAGHQHLELWQGPRHLKTWKPEEPQA